MAKKFLPDVIAKIGAWEIDLWVANYPNRWESLKELNFFFVCDSVIHILAFVAKLWRRGGGVESQCETHFSSLNFIKNPSIEPRKRLSWRKS